MSFRIASIIALFFTVLSAGARAAALPMVTVAWDGSGDYGPQTLGTKTCGWQEAISYCTSAAHLRDLYVKGGGTYNISETITIPAFQDFRIDGGAYTMKWVGPAEKDMLVFDSAMDARFYFSKLVYGGTGAALRIRPVTPVPTDNFVVFTDSQVKALSIENPNPQGGGSGVILDGGSTGSINRVDFDFGSIRNFSECLGIRASFGFCRLRCSDLRTNAAGGVLANLAGGCAMCMVELHVGPVTASGVKGVDITGAKNVIEVTTAGGFAPGNDVVLEAPSSSNQINISAPGSVSDPLSTITDNATSADNQITWAGAQPPVRSVTATPGTFTYVQRLYPAVVRLVGGSVSQAQLIRGTSSPVDYSIPPGDILLGVGDQLKVTSASAPTLQIAPLKLQ